MQAWRFRQLPQGPLLTSLLSLLTPFSFGITLSCSVWLPSFFFFFPCLRGDFGAVFTDSSSLPPPCSLGRGFEPLLFSSQTQKNENTAQGAPTSRRLCQLTSGHGAAAGAHSGQGQLHIPPSFSSLHRSRSPACRGRAPAPRTAKVDWVPPHQKW